MISTIALNAGDSLGSGNTICIEAYRSPLEEKPTLPIGIIQNAQAKSVLRENARFYRVVGSNPRPFFLLPLDKKISLMIILA